MRTIVLGVLIFVLSLLPEVALAAEPEEPTVIFDTDLALPALPSGDGSGTPVCIDEISGLLVAGCEGAVGPEGPPGPQGEPGNLALADMVCPEGKYLIGFDGGGNLLCAVFGQYCGNGAIEGSEVCDDENKVGGDGCSADCLSDETCGNGIYDPLTGEQCDGSDLAGETCQSLGYKSGSLACELSCTFDVSGCSSLSSTCTPGEEGGSRCNGSVIEQCNDSIWIATQDCGEIGEVCIEPFAYMAICEAP